MCFFYRFKMNEKQTGINEESCSNLSSCVVAVGTPPPGHTQVQQMSQQSPAVCSPDSVPSSSTPKNSERKFMSCKRTLQEASPILSGSSAPTKAKHKKISNGPTNTPISSNTRTAWVPLLVKMNGKIQIKIMVQKANGTRGPFTSAGPNSKLRPCWDSVLDCELISETKSSGKLIKEFLCTSSDRDKHCFRADTIDPCMTATNPFTLKMSELVMKNLKLLGQLISLMSRSKSFFNSSDKFEDNGVAKDGSGITVAHLEEAGGSRQELENFISLAEKNFVDMGGDGCDTGKKRSKKITDFFNPKPDVKKMTKQEIVEKNFQEEMQSTVGLEKSLVSQYVDFSLIPLDRLQISPQLFLKLNRTKVEELAASMEERYDPSAVVLMVCPDNFEKFEKTGESDIYNVLHGTHRLAALKLLDENGRLSKLPGLVNKRVPCYLVKTATASVANYCNIRANDLSVGWSKVCIHELIFVYFGLLKYSKDPEQSREAVTKICYSRHVPQEDISAILKIADWNLSALEKLALVLEKFQQYQTLDKQKGDKTRYRRRQNKAMTKNMFRALGRVKDDFFEENYDLIMSNTVSLQHVVNESEKNLLLAKTEQNTVLAAGVESVQELNSKFPNMFDNKKVEDFMGAIPYGKKSNKQGDRLKDYVKSVQTGTKFDDPVKLSVCENVVEVTSEVVNKFNLLVFMVSNLPDGYIRSLIDHVGSSYSQHEARSVFLVLDTQSDLIEVLTCLETWRDKEGFSVQICFFEKEKNKSNDDRIKENVTYGVIFGKLNVFRGELKTSNKPIESELKRIVDQISPPHANIAFISLGKMHVIQLHSATPDKNQQVTYFISKKVKDSLQERFLVGVLSKEDNPSNAKKTGVDDGDTLDVDVDSLVDEEEEETLGIEEEDEEDSDGEEEGAESGFDHHENFLGMARSASTSSK